MSVRYVHNTAGEYVAFVSRDNLFTPDCQWLGVVQAGREVYNTEGLYIGELQTDDRLVRNIASQLPRQTLRPRPPLQPMRPLPSRRRLFMPAVSPSHEDVFQGARRSLTILTPLHRLRQLDALAGASVIAADGTFLGRVSRDSSDGESLTLATGDYGSPYAERSIFNAGGRYGSTGSPLSPYHPTSSTPPRLERDGEVLAYLSVNPELAYRVHPGELIAWLKLG